MGTVHFLLLIYAFFLAALQVPVMIGYVLLKKRGLLRPWHFIAVCVLIFLVGHTLPAVGILFSPWALVLLGPLALSPVLGAACGLVWWYVLVGRPISGQAERPDVWAPSA